ncbi:MAG: hypothetical protein IJC66_06615 [Kiritimatiellae bacterium]|nr:hypothetical protein [Kiritimatiellia bacterium]
MCPSVETIHAAIEHPDAGCPDVAGTVFWHLLHCRECRAALTFVCTAVAFERDLKRQQALWRQFQARMPIGLVFRKDHFDGEGLDAIAAEAPAALVLRSSVTDADIHFWRATITFPDVDQPEAPLPIHIDGADRTPVQNGTFILFGIEIPIENGTGELTRAQLAECHYKGGAAFRWQDGSEVPGAPVLNA